jgi:esterase/lipase
VRYDTNYTRLPVNSIMTFIDYQRLVKRRLAEVVTPALIIGTHADRLVDPSMSRLVYDCISTPPDQKQLLWFDSSGHEMLRDCEREKVAEIIGQWVIALRDRLPAGIQQ